MHLRERKHKKGDTAKLAAELAPLEEQDKRSAAKQVGSTPLNNLRAGAHDGAIVVDSTDLSLPKDMIEGRDGKRFLGVEPVVLVILSVMLVFIAFITWQISLMPAE